MKELLSALMDGEFEKAAAQKVLDAMDALPDLQRVWGIYQLIGAVLRGEPLLSAGFGERCREKLAREPAVMIDRPSDGVRSQSSVTWAAAAAVAGVGVVVWAALGMQADHGRDFAMPGAASSRDVQPLVFRDEGERAEYLLAHQGVSPSGMLAGFSHYARTVARIGGGEGAAGR